MRDTTIARNYAQALFEAGRPHDEEEAYGAAFRSLTDALDQDPRARRFLETPKVERKAKQAVMRAALEGRVPERFLRFVLVTIAKDRQRLLAEIRSEYETILDAHAGRIHAQVTLAREADPDTVRLLGERLSAMLEKNVVPHVSVNPAILGGLVVRYGDRRMDGSLRRQLLSLKREMLNASMPELPATTG